MKKNNKEEKIFLNEKEKTEQIINHHKPILDKNHSFQETINHNNKSKNIKRKNKFREFNEPLGRLNPITSNPIKSKSKDKVNSKAKIKKLSNNKKINQLQDLNQNKNNYNNFITEQSYFSNNTNNNNFVTNNTTSIGAHTSNNTIITMSNKIPSNNFEPSSKTIPVQKQKDKNNKDNNNNLKDIKKTKNNNDNNKKILKKMLDEKNKAKNKTKNKTKDKNKKETDKRGYNYYINGQNLNLYNNNYKGHINLYSNNLFLNKIIKNDDDINNIYKTNNENEHAENNEIENDNISIATFNTINDNLSSNNNTSNREYSNRTLIKKNKYYQDNNIMLKKKQLGMYSPLALLKTNFELPTKNNKNYNNKIYSNKKNKKFNKKENIRKSETNLSSNFDIDNKSNNDIDIDKKMENKYNFYVNINNYNNEGFKSNRDSNATLENYSKSNSKSNKKKINKNDSNNINQVNHILSALNRIKNTKQIYNNKKALAFTKVQPKKERKPLYSLNHSSFLKYNPYYSSHSYSRFVDKNINNHFFYYSRSNSKNVMNDRNKKFNQKFQDFRKKASKSNRKLTDRSFMSEADRMEKKNSTNELLLSYQQKRNKMHYLKNYNHSANIKSEYTYKENDKNKLNLDINDIRKIKRHINSSSNIYNNSDIYKQKINNKQYTKNNNLRSVTPAHNINKIRTDIYANTTIANINKHCDTLLSKINQKIREERKKERQKDREKREKERKRYKEREKREKDREKRQKDREKRQKEREKERESEAEGERERERERENSHDDKVENKNEKNNENNQTNDINNKEISQNKKVIKKKIISNASLCRKGLNRQDEMEKINQDTLFKVKFGDINYSYYGVCDGHGPTGHFVSDFIKSNIAFIVYKYLKSLLINQNKNSTDNLFEVDDSNIDFPELFKNCFLTMDSKLNNNKSIDIELSGTTCVSLLFCENRIISANVGDSRAIKGYYDTKKKKWSYIPLSRDHKPTDKDESERIIKCKGLIHPYIDEDGNFAGPNRVWIDDELPGLAMSRSFGDEIATRVGVFSEPEVKIFPFQEEDKFIVIASDGLWEYVTNDEVIEIVSEYFMNKDCDGAVSELYEVSHERWVQYDDYIDDISIIVVFLDSF